MMKFKNGSKIEYIDESTNQKPRQMKKLKLIDPKSYTGYAAHPAEDDTLRVVHRAFIYQDNIPRGWCRIFIEFVGGKTFSTHSPSILGAKQRFAFQCRAGSKWTEEK